MKAQGNIGGKVVFSLLRNGSEREQEVRLSSLFVQRQDGVSWTSVWAVEGDARVKAIVYGEIPKGAHQLVQMQPLEASKAYRVIANFVLGAGPGLASCQFSTDANEQVVEEGC